MQLSNRMVKDDFWTDSELIQELPPEGRMFYQGLWQLAEQTGVLENDPMAYKMQLFPGDREIGVGEIQEWTDKLVELGKLIEFTDNGESYFYIKNFHKHQSFSHPAKPELPLPEFIKYIPNPKKRRSGAYSVDYSKINGSHEKGMQFVGKPPEDYEKDTGDAQESHGSRMGDEKEVEVEVEKEKENNTTKSNDLPEASDDGPLVHEFHSHPPEKPVEQYNGKDMVKYFGYLMHQSYNIPYTPTNWGKEGNNAKQLINKYGEATTARAIYWLVNIYNQKPEHFGWVVGSIQKFVNWKQQKQEKEEYEKWLEEQKQRGQEIAEEVYGNEGEDFTKSEGIFGGMS